MSEQLGSQKTLVRRTPQVMRMPKSERGMLVGRTGSGKSTLARFLLLSPGKTNLVIIDPKRNFKVDWEMPVATRPSQLNAIRKGGVIYRPDPQFNTWQDFDPIFNWIFTRGDTFCYIDEATGVVGTNASQYPFWLRSIYVQGRELNIGILAATQRPSGLPRFMFSESERFWMFQLTLLDDRKRMAEYMGMEGDKVLGGTSRPHSFFFHYILEDSTREYEVDPARLRRQTSEH